MTSVAPREDPQLLWSPSSDLIKSSHWTRFTAFVNATHGLSLSSPHDLWQWSVDHVGDFWAAVWAYTGIRASVPYTTVLVDGHKMPGATFFTGARLNMAENLLRFRDDRVALHFQSESTRDFERITYNQLYDRVARLSHRLRQIGVTVGDRVVGLVTNCPDAAVAMLATISLGAVWSSCSPDFGKAGVLQRFAQITPKVFFASDGYVYKGKHMEMVVGLEAIVDELPTVEKAVLLVGDAKANVTQIRHAQYLEAFLNEMVGSVWPDVIEFAQVPFDHPVLVVYSSGTTGLPKCVVQGVGVLLNHLKEQLLHLNITRDDVVLYYTTTGWVMWNWLLSGLAIGATVVLFDGNPLYPNAATLWQLAQDVGITYFGVSARYLAAVMAAGCMPRTAFDLSKLKTILSTGSPATRPIFEFIYTHIHPTVHFASISGGTELNGCFALGCSNLPVLSGEIQMRGLGMDVCILDDDGCVVQGQQGELVCRQPFPSMPLHFVNDSDGTKYFEAYFNVFPNVWRHGDFAELTTHDGLVIYGRSDATLNPGGVRLGTTDIYAVMEQMPEIADSIVVGKDYTLPDGTPDVKIVLFVVLAIGVTLDDALTQKIRATIRADTSPRHVPHVITACPDVPYTMTGKKVEVAVTRILNGKPVSNATALQNPHSVAWFCAFAATITP
ncbi:Aste57867_12694 [Aphanomyces stellatus]|uniref:Aste57867_12694 protein n=1 Tax=Aphanomyces stellatus TaxID=120398 RepID=A0A485KY95_9STRA|nr:hypothetical protein As57867_012647 [Aphanomyces stellatus]VFT89544.1 Aste57867_12694 [Aphanomyces stellatus]